MFIGEQTSISHEEIHITYAIIWEWSSFFVVLLELISTDFSLLYWSNMKRSCPLIVRPSIADKIFSSR